ncbi:MAG: hypothetical protein JSW46_00900 [Gemmatimonadota bacterium]|nr:MAG: hypothetical protein JSW46_00900 [Gemmatimonadota bacterium]
MIYCGAALVAYQAVQALTEGLGLPQWFPAFAIVLFIVGLPIVLATAFVHEVAPPRVTRAEPTPLTEAEAARVEAEATAARHEVRRRHRFLTWRNAAATFVIVLAAWGVVATGWYLLADRAGPEQMEAAEEMRKSIAVLPFENLSPDPENEFFADGIHDEIIAHLSKIADLRVISRTSVMEYKGRSGNLRTVAEELNVTNILEGTVRRANGEVRITTQLIDALADEHLWTEVYDRNLSDVFAVQSDVAQQVATALRATLSPAERELIAERPTDNLEAYDWYLRGNQYYIDREEYRIAVDLYENAVELDPDFALAYARLAMAETELYWWIAEERTEERLARARRAADRALQLDPDLPEGHMAMGLYHYWGHLDYDSAVRHLAIAQRGLSGQADGYWPIAIVQRLQGKFEEAALNLRKAFELSPRIFWMARTVATTQYHMRDYEQAEAYLDRAIELAPEQFGLYLWKAALYLSWEGNRGRARQVLQQAWTKIYPPPLYSGNDLWQWWLYRIIDTDYEHTLRRLNSGVVETDTTSYLLTKAELHALNNQPALARAIYDSARAILESRIEADPARADLHSQIGVAFAGLGHKEEAIREAGKAVELIPVSKDVLAGYDWIAFLAEVYVMVGEHGAAIDQLEYLLSIPGWLSIPWLQVDPIWDPLRNHPRFQALLEDYEQ